MTINKQDFLNIKQLLEDETITEGRFKNKEIIKLLRQNGSVVDGKRGAKVRYVHLVKRENIFLFLNNYDYKISSVLEIDEYIKNIFDAKVSRDTIQKFHNNTKARTSKSMYGLHVSSLQSVDIKLDDEMVSILAHNGLGYFLFHTQKIELHKDTVVVGVENYQVVWFAKKYKKFFGNNALFVVVTPYMLEWIQDLQNEYIHFGDYDLAGISIYLNKIIPRLQKSKKYSMFIPENIGYLVRKYGNAQLYENQKQYQNLQTDDEEVRELIKIINDEKKGIEQEGIHLLGDVKNG